MSFILTEPRQESCRHAQCPPPGTVSLQMGFNLPGVGRTAAPASAGEESPGSEGQGAGGNPGRSDPTESATETRPPAPASAEASKGEKVG